ncbi:hypothetical protein QZH41_006319 [Actinostola sp. cb2023]|nr:hypothetical protein QZH41_006319 [Actinostola sp. cb2023]
MGEMRSGQKADLVKCLEKVLEAVDNAMGGIMEAESAGSLPRNRQQVSNLRRMVTGNTERRRKNTNGVRDELSAVMEMCLNQSRVPETAYVRKAYNAGASSGTGDSFGGPQPQAYNAEASSGTVASVGGPHPQAYNAGAFSGTVASFGGPHPQAYNAGASSGTGALFGGPRPQAYNAGASSGTGALFGGSHPQAYNAGASSGTVASFGGPHPQAYNAGASSGTVASFGAPHPQAYNAGASSGTGASFGGLHPQATTLEPLLELLPRLVVPKHRPTTLESRSNQSRDIPKWIGNYAAKRRSEAVGHQDDGSTASGKRIKLPTSLNISNPVQLLANLAECRIQKVVSLLQGFLRECHLENQVDMAPNS